MTKYAYEKIDVDPAWMDRAVRWACRRVRHTIDRGNMNERGLTERLDDIAMGEIASAAVADYLERRGSNVVAYDDVRIDEYRDPDPGWDLLILKGRNRTSWPDGADPAVPPEDAYTFSVKASRIPQADKESVETAISRRDFKILKKSDGIARDITADFEVQVYYPFERSRYSKTYRVPSRAIDAEDVAAIEAALDIERRYRSCYITGFASRETLIRHSSSLPASERIWHSRHEGEAKPMWTAPLRLGSMPSPNEPSHGR